MFYSLLYCLFGAVAVIHTMHRVLVLPQPCEVFWMSTQVRLSGSSNHINTKTKYRITALVKELYITLLDQEINNAEDSTSKL